MPSLLLSVLMHPFDIKAVCGAVKGERGGNQEALKVLNKLIQSAKLNFPKSHFHAFITTSHVAPAFSFITWPQIQQKLVRVCAHLWKTLYLLKEKGSRMIFISLFFWQMNGQC